MADAPVADMATVTAADHERIKIMSCQSTGTMVLIIAHQSLPVYKFTTDPDGPSKIVHSFTD